MRAQRLGLFILAAGMAAVSAAPGAVLPSSDGAGFEQALAPREFAFPRDHGAHPTFAHEWWYLTGHLDAASGERFGFELTFFRVALGHPASAAADASQWRARQMYLAHFALTDIGRGQFHFQERAARAALGLSGATASPLKVWLDDWSLEEADGTWRIHAAARGYALDLQMTVEHGPVLNGEHGLSQKSSAPADASYYYSLPRLAVRGQLVREAQPLDVSGTAWLDREWGSGGLGADEVGWDWFALQLADGSELMFYSLRRRDGGMDPHSAGTWVGADGRVRALSSADVRIRVQGDWRSPRGGRYPALWTVEVPAIGLRVGLRPELADQELEGPPRYWEGAVQVTGSRGARPIGGAGYVELVGYAPAP
ncbi:MAG TPA: lipocalin-like domain-containing protein [Steroidobacteraceae bacterium]|jgi:predicted secreted hydrolase|nr:lipocalin-like domain-containing protein [Steroidobacteraceae bacterium]